MTPGQMPLIQHTRFILQILIGLDTIALLLISISMEVGICTGQILETEELVTLLLS